MIMEIGQQFVSETVTFLLYLLVTQVFSLVFQMAVIVWGYSTSLGEVVVFIITVYG